MASTFWEVNRTIRKLQLVIPLESPTITGMSLICSYRVLGAVLNKRTYPVPTGDEPAARSIGGRSEHTMP